MRLITLRDRSLAVALIVGTLIAFERPFRWLLDLVHEVEQRYRILLPALTLDRWCATPTLNVRTMPALMHATAR